MNYFPFHIGDYLSATRHLSWEEDMAYRRLLDTYYTTEKPLPAEARACCRLVLAQTDGQREAVQTVLQEFFTLGPDGWINARADAELANLRERQQAARDKANKRWHKPTAERSNADAMPQHPKPNATADATASKGDANAVLPVPVPVPVKTKDKDKSIVAALLAEVDAQIATDWQAMRKAKRAPVTATALDGIRAEALKAGMSLQDALAMCCQRGWTGFKADWAGVNGQRAPPNGMTPYQQMQVEKHEQNKRFNKAILGEKPDGRTDAIDGIAERVD